MVGGEEAVVTFSVQTTGLGSRAVDINDGKKATELTYAIYDEAWNHLQTYEAEFENGSLVKELSLRLVKNKTYNFVFWAQNPNVTCYTMDFETAGQKPSVSVNYDALVANNDNYDAFFGQELALTVNGTVNKTVYLKRPFAQINFGTDDLQAAKELGFDLAQAKVSVTTMTYSKFFLNDGAVDGATREVTFTEAAAIDKTAADKNLSTKSHGDYHWVSMNYILWPNPDVAADASKDLSLSKCEMTIAVTGQTPIKVEVPQAPARRNWRTNLVGSLLTEQGNIKVEINPDLDNEDGHGAIDGKIYVRVKSAEEFNAAFADENVDIIILEEDIVLSEAISRAADPALTISKDKALTIDLNNFTLSATSSATGKNYQMFDVYGTLTVKNGNLEYVHNGANMAWNNCTALFHVGGNGVLNIDGVVAKNLGGSDMAYVVDLTNATNIVVDVDNSTLESTYIPVRVFNNMKNGVNNVAIKNSTLKGKYCFWVQYWLADGRDEATLQQTLNLDIFNSQTGESNNNVFVCSSEVVAPVLYGFDEFVYFDQYGNTVYDLEPIIENGVEVQGIGILSSTKITDAEGNEVIKNTYGVTTAEGLDWIAKQINGSASTFEGETIKLLEDVILEEGFQAIGYNSETGATSLFEGVFDGNGHTIKSLKQSDLSGAYRQSTGLFAKVNNATFKNLAVEDFEVYMYGGEAGVVATWATGDCVFEDITIKDGEIIAYNCETGAVLGWAESGNFTFKDITITSDVTVESLWSSWDTPVGGIIGGIGNSTGYTMSVNIENANVACKIDVYNDVTSSYKWYAYRRAGMLIGNVRKTQTNNGRTTPNPIAENVTCKNVTVTYGNWVNYHYCEGYGQRGWQRVEAGFTSGALAEDHTHTDGQTHLECLPFDQLFGGGQGVYGLASYDGVTVNYPEEYTCPLCGKQHNVK